VAVKAYTASTPENGQLRLNQLHDACHGRIKYEKTCPLHGPVSSDQIVMGYQYGQEQYVVVDLAELDILRSAEEKRAIRIDTFVAPQQVGCVFHTDKHYYLLPDGAAARLPYALLHQAMRDKRVHAVGQVVLSKREQLVLIRPLDNLFAMTVLRYASQVRLPSCLGEETDNPPQIGQEELSLAQALVDGHTRRQFDLHQYTDQYTVKLEQLIDAKVKGKELVAAPQSEPRQALSLMDALKASVAEAGSSAAADGARGALARQLSRPGGKGKRGTARGKKRSKASGSGKPKKKTA
jgi:DNA end-binding protein Ku